MIQDKNNRETQVGRACLQGALAGCLATIPMTLFMLTTQRFLPKGQRYDLPPEIITKELAHQTHMKQHMNKKQILGVTLVSHLGYGTLMGACYGSLSKRIPLPPIVLGMLFGIVVWAASYLGLLPLLGMVEAGQREPVRRNLMMIAAHIVWGTALGAANTLMS